MPRFIVRVVVQQEMEFEIEADSKSTVLQDERIERAFIELGPRREGDHMIAEKRIVGQYGESR